MTNIYSDLHMQDRFSYFSLNNCLQSHFHLEQVIQKDIAVEITLSSFLPSTPKEKGFCVPHSLVYFLSTILNFVGTHQMLIDGKDTEQLFHLFMEWFSIQRTSLYPFSSSIKKWNSVSSCQFCFNICREHNVCLF